MVAMADHKLLSIYLNDHLAIATSGRELARRALGSNRRTEFEPFLERLADELEEDRDSLLDIMRRLDVGEDRIKQVLGWALEKAGRLKLNGMLTGYSPLSRVVELEALSIGVTGKLAGWRSLVQVAASEPRLAAIDLGRLIERGERQRAEFEQQRLRAVELALVEE
jgi:hypothetical protein